MAKSTIKKEKFDKAAQQRLEDFKIRKRANAERALKIQEHRKEMGRKTIERVKNSRLPHSVIYTSIGVSSTNFSRFMNEKEGGITQGLITRINEFLDNHKV